MSNYLDCAHTRLQQGVTLVEASAGTGKTYAIAMLVLRAVCEKGIPVEQILVVTFTRAATEELRNRIRNRLVEARELLSGEDSVQTDATMTSWVATIEDRGTAVKRLNLALLDIDRAEIFTIHSFCQRMLQEQALECGQFFDVELQADISQIRDQIVEDFWRRHIYSMEQQPCGAITSRYPTPKSLHDSIRSSGSEYDEVEPVVPGLVELALEFSDVFQSLNSWYLEQGSMFYGRLLCACEEGKLKKPLSAKEDVEKSWREVEAYFLGKSMVPPDALKCLSRDGMTEVMNLRKVKKDERDGFLDDFGLPDELAQAFLTAKENLHIAFRRELIEELSEQLGRRLQDLGLMSYDDLIARLHVALRDDSGELKRVLAGRYKMALIDEFQDTDSAQWDIFSSIFGDGRHFLYLIGDPKQAIYKFRGADINSYFRARSTATHHLTLEQNHRSHPELVGEINRLFSFREEPFLYDRKKMPFHEVHPARTEDDGMLVYNGQPLSVMNYWQLTSSSARKSGKWSAGAAASRLLRETLTEVQRLLDPKNPALYQMVEDGHRSCRPLQPKDIAILVRTNGQAQWYLEACAEVGVPAVISSKKSVYATLEANELYRLLLALMEPGNVLVLKSAMTISWFGLSGNDLYKIWSDEVLFDDWMNRFLNYSRLWNDKGFLVMMHKLLEEEDVLLHLAGLPLGERRIANIHQLLELVQEAETDEKLGPDQSVLRLETSIAGKVAGEDAEQRLESDEEAIRIVTMHSAKGLQYPVVFCPYLWYRDNRLGHEKEFIKCHENDRIVIDLGSSQLPRRRELALQEELAEELRLLYVAVTRAQVSCYVMIANCQGSVVNTDIAQSSLGYLFFSGEKREQAEQESILRNFIINSQADYRLLPEEGPKLTRFSGYRKESPELTARSGSGRLLHTDYQMSSYSAMASLSEHDDHGAFEAMEKEQSYQEVEKILHPGLPAGASFGNLVHDSLELVPFGELSEISCEENLTGICRRYGLDVQPSALRAMLADVAATPLKSGNGQILFSLSELEDSRCIKEMAFYFHLNRLDTEAINNILENERTVIPLSAKSMRGYLTGFVDLVCEYQGKYYVIDYKTNYLGENIADYQGERLVQAMASHNYGLQYWIYTLVLHRYLQNVLKGYDFSDHFGGVLYLFVRGMVPERPGSGIYYGCPDKERLDCLDRLLGDSDGH